MNARKYNISRPNGSKLAVGLSHYFSSSDESLDDDLLQNVQAAPVSTHKPIFQIPERPKKIRQSLVNQNKLASSTLMHEPQKAFHQTIPLSPVVTRKYNRRNGSKVAVDLSHYFSNSDESPHDDLLQNVQAAPASTHKRIFQIPERTKKIRQSLVNRNKFASSTPMPGPQKVFHRSIPLSPVENGGSEDTLVKSRRNSSIASKQSQSSDTVWLDELLSCHLNDGVSEIPSSHNTMIAEDQPLIGKELRVRLEKLDLPELPEEEIIQRIHSSSSRTKSKVAIGIEENDINTDRESCASRATPKINIIENRIINEIPTSTKENFKPPRVKNRQKRNKKPIPEILTDTGDESQDPNLRRSKRKRKQRVYIYNPQILLLNSKQSQEYKLEKNGPRSWYKQGSPLPEIDYKDRTTTQKSRKCSKAKKSTSEPNRKTKKFNGTRNSKRINKSIVDVAMQKENQPIDTGEQSEIEPTNLIIYKSFEIDSNSPTVNLKDTENNCMDLNDNVEESHFNNSDGQADPQIYPDSKQRNYFYFPMNNKVRKINYCFPDFSVNTTGDNESLRIAPRCKSSHAGFESGLLEIQPGQAKTRKVAVKFSKVFVVLQGKGLFCVHDSYCIVEYGAEVYVPLGTSYYIANQSQTDKLLLHYIKLEPKRF